MPRSSKVVRDLLLLIGLPFASMVGLLIWGPTRDPGQAPGNGDLFAALAGRWTADADLAACVAGGHTIAFDSTRARMSITWASGTVDEYLIQGQEPDRLITLLVGDARRDDDGAQVVWLLITSSDTSYVWRRRDWIAGHVSEPSIRCSPSATPAAILPE
jgi:hypothetical protein